MQSNFYKIGLTLSLLVLLTGCILQTLGGSAFPERQSTSAWGLDDAYIPYRYAENLVHGGGLVFNLGERVEGYSDFLYVLAVAPAFWLTDRDGVYFFSVLLNIACALGALWLFSDYIHRRLGERSAVAATLLFALCPPLWAAVAGGLETSAQLLISVAIWVWAERVAAEPTRRNTSTLAVLAVLSLLIRADGFLIPGVAILYLILRRRVRPAGLCALTLAVAAGVFELWRWEYYGALLPTTYYVKVAGSLVARLSHARDEFVRIALLEGLWPYIVILLSTLAMWAYDLYRRGQQAFNQLRFEMLFTPLWIAYWFYIGGDHFWDRFLIVLYPLGIFALLRTFEKFTASRGAAVGLLLLAAVQAGTPALVDSRFRYDFNKYDCWIGTGKFLGEKYPGKRVAVGALGKIPYFSGMYAIDILGLADPVVAHLPAKSNRFEPGHLKFDPDYTLSRHPDVIALSIFPNGDFSFGLTRTKYEQAGYRLEYLVDTRRSPPAGLRLIEVNGIDEKTVSRMIASGYEYGIVVKN